MKVKLFRQVCCPEGSFEAETEAELSDGIANGLIEAGYAESLEVKEENPAVEQKANARKR